MPRENALYIVDIFLAVEKIRRYTADFDSSEKFFKSDIHWDATMRELQVIGDATNNLIKNSFLDNKYRIIVDFRNLITHAYFGIDHKMVWDIIHEELSQFINEIKLNINEKKLNLDMAISYAIKEEELRENFSNIDFLKRLLFKLSVK